MEAPVINHDGPIIIKETPAQKQDDVPKKVAGDKKERAKIDSKYLQPKWCPPRLNKTQRRKLQRARHRQQEREKLAKMEGEVVNSEQVKNPLEDRRATVTTANLAKPALGLASWHTLLQRWLSQPQRQLSRPRLLLLL
jgi:hypothetical protein